LDERVNIVVDAFREAVREGFDVKVLLAIFVIFFLIVVFLVFWDRIKHLASKRFLKKLFLRYAKDALLTDKEAEILWEYSQKLERDPFLVLEFKSPFEKVIELYIEENPDYDEKMIKDMRKKLGFDINPYFIPLISTKDIDIYQTGTLITEHKKTYPVALFDKTEKYMYWVIIDKQPPFDFKEGSKVKIKFLRRDDAFYSFEGIVEEISQEDGKYILKIPHTFKLEKVQRRKEVRMKVEIPLNVLKVDEKTEQKIKFTTETTDISIEGIGFCLPILSANNFNLKVGDKINLNFKLENEEFFLEGIIKNSREVGRKVCYGVKFINVDKKDKEKLTKFVQKEQQKILKVYNLRKRGEIK